MMLHAYNPSTWKRQRKTWSSRPSWAIDTLSEKKTTMYIMPSSKFHKEKVYVILKWDIKYWYI